MRAVIVVDWFADLLSARALSHPNSPGPMAAAKAGTAHTTGTSARCALTITRPVSAVKVAVPDPDRVAAPDTRDIAFRPPGRHQSLV